jgi:hypothetical protein
VDQYSVAIGFALLLGVARVQAAPSEAEPLTVSLSGCPTSPVSATALVSAIELELSLRRRPILSHGDAPAAISVRVDCGGRASIRVRLAGTEHQRHVRVDDVPAADRPRILALVVAELVRSGPDNAAISSGVRDTDAVPAEPTAATDSPRPAAADETVQRPAKRAPSEGTSRPDSGSLAVETRRNDLRLWMCAWSHLSSGASNAMSGGAAGIQWHRSRLQTELGFASVERPRGRITSGVGAMRYRYSAPLLGAERWGFNAALSSSAGVTWAIGESEVPGVVVRRALSPYADARVELALELWLTERIAAELDIYSGGALGLLATDLEEGVLSSGGWLLGASIGSSF